MPRVSREAGKVRDTFTLAHEEHDATNFLMVDVELGYEYFPLRSATVLQLPECPVVGTIVSPGDQSPSQVWWDMRAVLNNGRPPLRLNSSPVSLVPSLQVKLVEQ